VEADDVRNRTKVPRAVVFVFALAVLFETWIWGGLVAVGRGIVALIPWTSIKPRLVAAINYLPAPAALLLFGVPLVVVEVGSFGSVVLVATGHFVAGALSYLTLKIVGLGLVAVIFDLTREKLLTMRWFVYVYEKFLLFHDYAHHLVAPYKQAAAAYVAELRERTRAYWQRMIGASDEIG
jgi:hypothetical protein